jgi:hypothetical protein
MVLLRNFLLIILLFTGGVRHLKAQKEIFIKQIEFKLEAISDIDYENEYFVTLKMNKGSKYTFKITNHQEGFVGEAVIELLDADNLVLTNIYGDQYYPNVAFQCNKTGFYDLLVKFRDNKVGFSVIDVLLVQ